MNGSGRTVLYPDSHPLAAAARERRFHLSRAANDSWRRFAENNGWKDTELTDALAGLVNVPDGMLAQPLGAPAVAMWNPDYPILLFVAIPEGDRTAIIGIRLLRRAEEPTKFRIPKGKYGRGAWEWLVDAKRAAAKAVEDGEPVTHAAETYLDWLDEMLGKHRRYASADEVAEMLPNLPADGEPEPVRDVKAFRAKMFREVRAFIGDLMDAQPAGMSGEYAAAVLDKLRDDLKAVIVRGETAGVVGKSE